MLFRSTIKIKKMRNSIISFSKIAFAFLALAGMTTLTSCDDDDEKFVNPKGEKEYNVYFNLGKYNSDENYLVLCEEILQVWVIEVLKQVQE